jgi:hypothetical protein
VSKSSRKHESEARRARRGPKNVPEDDAPRARLKSAKQTRVNERVALRREWR